MSYNLTKLNFIFAKEKVYVKVTNHINILFINYKDIYMWILIIKQVKHYFAK